MINPNDTKLLKDFLAYLEQEGKSSGYILCDKGSWDHQALFYRKIPPKGETTRVRIDFSISRPSSISQSNKENDFVDNIS